MNAAVVCSTVETVAMLIFAGYMLNHGHTYFAIAGFVASLICGYAPTIKSRRS